MIRHGESYANQNDRIFRKKMEHLDFNSEEYQSARFDAHVIPKHEQDALLNDTGVEQARSKQAEINQIKLDTKVYVSP